MPVTDEYIEFVRGLLGSFERLRVKRMFGGAGVYWADVFFAIVVDDAFYLKVEDRTRRGYERRGFRPFASRMKNGRTATMSCYPVPPELLDHPAALAVWPGDAEEAAKRAANVNF